MTHEQTTAAVRASLIGPKHVSHPREERRELPSPETQAAARTLTLALGRLESARHDFEAAREAFRDVLGAEERGA